MPERSGALVNGSSCQVFRPCGARGSWPIELLYRRACGQLTFFCGRAGSFYRVEGQLRYDRGGHKSFQFDDFTA